MPNRDHVLLLNTWALINEHSWPVLSASLGCPCNANEAASF